VSNGIGGAVAFALPRAAGEKMARSKGYAYTPTVRIPVSWENQLLPGTLGFAIQVLVERPIDTSLFGSRSKNDATGCPAYAPQILLKVILFAYARGLITSRKIEQAGREKSTFRALACGQVPDLRREQESVEKKLKRVLAQHEHADNEEGESSAAAPDAAQQKPQDQSERLARQAARMEAF
jgi:hypothetical protein